MLIPVLILAIFIVAGVACYLQIEKSSGGLRRNANEAKRKIAIAKRAYELSLEELKKFPNSPDARQTALKLGRQYASVTREHKSVTIFDELAMKNDIDAACAGATRTTSPRSHD